MNRLLQQQTALLDALFASPQHPAAQTAAPTDRLPFTGGRGLRAYQANATALAQRTLRAAFVVLEQLMGAEDFSRMAVDFWHKHPPKHGDLAQWGDALPVFLHGNPQLADEPYLADVASVEWAIHQAAMAVDPVADMSSFARLAGHHAADQKLRLASGCCVVASRFPVASIVAAHLHESPALERAGELLRAGVAENALVWRQGMRSKIRPCGTAEAILIQALANGQTLGAALAAADGLDFGVWLPQAVQEGLVLGVQPGLTPA